MTPWLRAYLAKPHYLILVGPAVAYELYYLSALRPTEASNGWDALFPALGTPHFSVVVVLLWWTVVLFSDNRSTAMPELLIRRGSRRRTVWHAIRRHAVTLAVGYLLLALISIPTMVVAGASLSWSSASKQDALMPVTDVYSAAHSAARFGGPTIAVVVAAGFCAIALLSMGALSAALTASGRVRTANSSMLLLYFWSACCAFGAATALPAIDTVGLFNYFWADEQRRVLLSTAFWLCCLLATLLVPSVQAFREVSRRAVFGWTGLLLAPVIVAAGSVGGAETSFDSWWTRVFLGRHGSLLDYLRVEFAIYLVATIIVVQHLDYVENRFTFMALRYGSRWRSFVVRSRMVVLQVAVSCGAIGAVILCASALFGRAPAPASFGLIAGTLVGLLVSMFLVSSVGLLTAMLFPTSQAWVWLAAGLLVAGYPAFFPVPWLGALSLYSSPSDSRVPQSDSPFVAGIVALLLVVVTIIAVVRIPARRNGSRPWTTDRIEYERN